MVGRSHNGEGGRRRRPSLQIVHHHPTTTPGPTNIFYSLRFGKNWVNLTLKLHSKNWSTKLWHFCHTASMKEMEERVQKKKDSVYLENLYRWIYTIDVAKLRTVLSFHPCYCVGPSSTLSTPLGGHPSCFVDGPHPTHLNCPIGRTFWSIKNISRF